MKDDIYLCAAPGHSCGTFFARTPDLAGLMYAKQQDLPSGTAIHVANKNWNCHEGWFVVSREEITVSRYSKEAKP